MLKRELPSASSLPALRTSVETDLGRSRVESETALAGTHEVERGFAGNCQAGGSIMSTGFGEPITPDPSQKQSRTPRTREEQEKDEEDEEEGEEEEDEEDGVKEGQKDPLGGEDQLG